MSRGVISILDADAGTVCYTNVSCFVLTLQASLKGACPDHLTPASCSCSSIALHLLQSCQLSCEMSTPGVVITSKNRAGMMYATDPPLIKHGAGSAGPLGGRLAANDLPSIIDNYGRTALGCKDFL